MTASCPVEYSSRAVSISPTPSNQAKSIRQAEYKGSKPSIQAEYPSPTDDPIQWSQPSQLGPSISQAVDPSSQVSKRSRAIQPN